METVELNRALDSVMDADEQELAAILVAGIRRLGENGRRTTELMLAQLEADNQKGDALLIEGLAQIEGLEGVVSGRTDSL